MPKIKNVSPLGALEVPLLGRVVDADEVISVTAAQAAQLAEQTETWEPVKSGSNGGGDAAGGGGAA